MITGVRHVHTITGVTIWHKRLYAVHRQLLIYEDTGNGRFLFKSFVYRETFF